MVPWSVRLTVGDQTHISGVEMVSTPGHNRASKFFYSGNQEETENFHQKLKSARKIEFFCYDSLDAIQEKWIIRKSKLEVEKSPQGIFCTILPEDYYYYSVNYMLKKNF